MTNKVHLNFIDFVHVPIQFYKTIGEELYEHRSTNRIKSLALKTLLYAGFLNFNILVLGELIYFVKALGSYEAVLQATAVAPCIGFSYVANFKQIALAVHKKTLRQHLDELERIFPDTTQKQLDYMLYHYEQTMQRVMVIFSFLCLAYTSTFSIYPICKSAVMHYLLGVPEFERNFGFFIWYPYNATQNRLVYGLSYMAGVAFFSADLLLVASVTILCMHFNFISERLEGYSGEAISERENLQFLQQIAVHHAKCLELCENVNNMAGLSLLLNFFTASLTICFIGFQVTASSLEDIIKYGIFLAASMVQVLVICYYGDALISASCRVGVAAYNQPWFGCSIRYKKLLSS